MHELNLEQGAETQISCVVELLQISADNKAIILAEMEASSNPVRGQHWQKLQPNVVLHRFAFLSLVLKSKTFSYRRGLVKNRRMLLLRKSPGNAGEGQQKISDRRERIWNKFLKLAHHHCPFLLSLSLPASLPPLLPLLSLLFFFLSFLPSFSWNYVGSQNTVWEDFLKTVSR